MKDRFAAYVVNKQDDRVAGRVDTLSLADLPAGEVTIKVAYSSLNYKDGLACTGRGGGRAQLPRTCPASTPPERSWPASPPTLR